MLLVPRELAALGIYEVAGDTLKLCLAQYSSSVVGQQRPKDFDIGPGSANILLMLKRSRASADEKAIQGQWVVTNQIDGVVSAVSPERLTSLSFLGGRFRASPPVHRSARDFCARSGYGAKNDRAIRR